MAGIRPFSSAYLQSLARRLFIAAGTPPHIADTVAEILVNANLAGHDSHGVLRVPAYLSGIEKGAIVPSAEPEVVQETDTTFICDGKNGFGHYIARRAMQRAIEKAEEANLCGVSLRRTGHIGRLGEYAEQAARAGCISLIATGGGGRGGGCTVPFGGAKGALGTNPIAVGVPTGDGAPFIIDYATSMIAEGKIQVARSQNADLPAGCIVDKHGNPSVKWADFYDGGFLLPFGGHKGYALSLLMCLLGGLSGHFNVERGAMGGTFMLVINVSAFTPLDDYQRAVRAFLNGIKSTPPAPGFNEVLVPGDFEHRFRVHRRAHGIALPDAIYRQIAEWAKKLKVALEEDEG
ncbi:MAG: Ldh family oxidoreductase [Abditibacteriales bacterium]|nr:Ldh family oxidoreductase [Abditibacteriales bacterium]MDW8366608.1 Ldh family oxidoreductase [Abditibacteriales bacterium]